MNESDFMKKLGNTIKFYRKKSNLTQSGLASCIGKSLASVSKYERGECAIDSFTLCEIAKVLHITVSQLLPPETEIKYEQINAPNSHPIKKANVFYLHYVGHSSQKLQHSMLQINWETDEVIMYVEIYDSDNYQQCRFVLHGNVSCTSASTSIWATNPSAPIDFFHVVINGADWFIGNHICRISYSTINWRSATSKAILTLTPKYPDNIYEQLEFSKQEIKQIKTLNQVVL